MLTARLAAAHIGAGEQDEEQRYSGAKGYEKVTWSSLYGQIAPGQTGLVDPTNSQFRNMLRDLFTQDKATINGQSYNSGMTSGQIDDLVNGHLDVISFDVGAYDEDAYGMRPFLIASASARLPCLSRSSALLNSSDVAILICPI